MVFVESYLNVSLINIIQVYTQVNAIPVDKLQNFIAYIYKRLKLYFLDYGEQRWLTLLPLKT